MSSVLVILGHPDRKSLCGALADAYTAAAKAAGHDTTLLALGELKFDPVLHHGYREAQTLEPDLKRAQDLITRCDHVALIFPLWWGSVPAVCKAFFDRTFLPGFAFRFREDSSKVIKLLSGRSADLVITMGAPSWVTKLVYGDPATKMVKKGLFQFCGITPVRVTRLDRVAERNEEELGKWIARMRELAGVLPRPKKAKFPPPVTRAVDRPREKVA